MKHRQSRFLAASLLGLAGATCISSAAFASGFGLREGAADWLGNAFAGDTAKAYDASTAWSNPAGMTRLDQSEIDGSISYIAPNAKFSGTDTDEFGAISGTTGGNAIQAAATGGVFGVWDLAPVFRLGFGLTAPYGERSNYPGDFVGRYQGLVSSITDIDLGLALAYKLNDHLSIGGGPNIDYFSARLTQAINVGPTLGALGDPIADVHGTDIGAGFNLGVLYQFDDATRLGLDYRSRIQHDISATQKISVPSDYATSGNPTAELTGEALNAGNSAANTAITLPDSFSLGLYHQITPKWAVMSDIQWTHWSLFNSITVTPTNGTASTTIPESWRNTWYAGIGTNYQVLDDLTLQTGFAYDESPVDNGNRGSRVPDSDHYVLGIGAKYQVLSNTSLQLAYAHIFTPGGTINHTTTSAAGIADTIAGTYDTSADSVTAGVTVKF